MAVTQTLLVRPGSKVRLKDHDPSGTPALAELLKGHKLPKSGKHDDETKQAAAIANILYIWNGEGRPTVNFIPIVDSKN